MTEKIFVVGFHKTGTTSLRIALEALGYRVTGPNGELLPAFLANDSETVRRVVESYDAFQDDPWFLFYQELYIQFPDSRFILLERDPKRWFRSVRKHFRNRVNKTRSHIYGQIGAKDAPKHYKKTYADHNAAVKAFFNDVGHERLLVLDLEEGDGWEPLCRFLGKPVPRTIFTRRVRAFPHANPATWRKFLRKHKHVQVAKRRVKTEIQDRLGSKAWDRLSTTKQRVLWRIGL